MDIKSPQDFIVEEIPLRKPSGKGDYTWFWLEKTNYTTTRAIMQIARALRLSKVRFGFAGNKDKFAITKQVVSAWKIEPKLLKNIKLKDIKIKVIGKDSERICLGDLKGNKFNILNRRTKKKIEKNNFIPNYFGPQRFSKSKNTHIVGRYIIKGELEAAAKEFLTGTTDNTEAKQYSNYAKKNWGKWKEILKKCPRFLGLEKSVLDWLIKNPTDFAGALRNIPKPVRRIFIHSYQSYIFNKALSEFIGKGDKINFLDFKLIFPKQKVETKGIKFLIPGTKMRLRKDKFSENIKKILKKEKITSEDFGVKRMPELASEGALREPFINIKDLKIEPGKDNIRFKFTLGKGSYATVVLMALFREEI